MALSLSTGSGVWREQPDVGNHARLSGYVRELSVKNSDPGSASNHAFVFDDAAGYELMMGRWSALVAEPFLDWLALPSGLGWLDSGCGDGSFTEQLVLRQSPSSVVGVDPAPAQLAFARQRASMASVSFLEGDAQALPVPSASVDAAVMALVLFFVPDPLRGIRELLRVTRPGGTIAAYHWDMAGGGSRCNRSSMRRAMRATSRRNLRAPGRQLWKRQKHCGSTPGRWTFRPVSSR